MKDFVYAFVVRECVCVSECVAGDESLTRPTPLGCSAWPVAAVPARRGSCAGEGLSWPTRTPRRPRSPSGSLRFRWSPVQRCSPRQQACRPPPKFTKPNISRTKTIFM